MTYVNKRSYDELAILVCSDCIQEVANGETPPDADPARETRPEFQRSGNVSIGWVGDDPDDAGEGDFTYAPCQRCTSDLAGDRFHATAWG